MKTVFFDIESGGLRAPFDQALCCAFKEYGKKPYVLSRNIKDTSDKDLCIAIKRELEKYDILVGYYSLGFDKPFISARLLKYKQKPLKRQLHIDCYRLAKKIFKYTLPSKRLVAICEYIGIKGKTRVEPDIWEQLKYDAVEGKRKALKQVVEHCLMDVVVLEEAFDQCFKYEVVSVSLS